MAKAKKLPSGNWRVQASVTINGKKIVESFTDSDPKIAEKKALEWQLSKKDIANGKMTLETAIDEYINIKDGVLSPSTIRGYDVIKRNYIGGLAKLRIDKITNNQIQKHINELSKKHSAKTVLNAYGLIESVMRQFCPNNDLGKITLPLYIPPKQGALSQQQMALFIKAIDGHRNEIPILLALWLGMRRSEIIGLDWDSDIDFENDTIHVHNAMVPDRNNKFVDKQVTKNKSSDRILHIPNYLKCKMLEVPEEERHGKVYKYFPGLLNKDIKNIFKSLNIENITLHCLRRSMATLGVTLNIADKLMMARGGWSNPKTMKAIYQMVLDQDLDTADKKIDSFFDSIIKSTSN